MRIPTRALTLAIVCAAPSLLPAQQRQTVECRDSWGSGARHCETRTLTIAAPRRLSVDGRPNGGVTVRGEDRRDVHIVASVHANAPDAARARQIADEVRVEAANGQVRASGPRTGRREGWSVSYEVSTPRQIDLDLSSTNGGLSVTRVEGRLDLQTTNGGISLTDVGGDVRGRATNGGLTLQLSGDRWVGAGADLRTTNGGITIAVPRGYSAQLEAETVNGGFRLDIPITVSGEIRRQLRTTLGSGGATISVATTNGGVVVRQR